MSELRDFYLFTNYLFRSYLRISFKLVAFFQRTFSNLLRFFALMWHKAILMGNQMKLELTRVTNRQANLHL